MKKPLAAGDAPDSVDTMGALLGTTKVGRAELIEQAGGQALRVGQWKYIEASKRPKMNVQTNTELGNDAVPQLYDLSKDPGERQNVAEKYPEKLAELQARLRGDSRQSGRTGLTRLRAARGRWRRPRARPPSEP